MRYRSYATRGEPPMVDCNRTRNGWECIGPRGRVWAEDKDDAIDEYLSRPGPFLFPGPIFIPPAVGPVIMPPPILGRPWIRGGRRFRGPAGDIDIDIKNEYNIKGGGVDSSPPTVPTSGGRDVPPPVDPTPEPSASGSFSMEGMPSWLLPVGAIGLVLVLVLVMKK